MEQTFEEFAERYALRLKFKEVETDPEKAWCAGVRSFKCKIKSIAFSGSLKTPYKCGPNAGDPDLFSVLYGLQSDSMAVVYHDDPFDFIEEYGYKNKPREGAAIYADCQEQLAKVRKYFGYAVTEELINCIE